MKKIFFLVALLVLCNHIANSQDKVKALKEYFSKDVLDKTKLDGLQYKVEEFDASYNIVTVFYNGGELGKSGYEPYGRAKSQGHPIIKSYSLDSWSIVILTFNADNDTRANLISHDRLWLIDASSGKTEEINVTGKIIWKPKEYENNEIKFLNFDYSHADTAYLVTVNVESGLIIESLTYGQGDLLKASSKK